MVAGRPLFIALEGGEGAGKSTQVRKLATYLEAKGQTVVQTREPGGTRAAERVREILLAGKGQEFDPGFEAFLFAAARYHHVYHVIKPALTAGKTVVCDRFVDSTRVYQGLGGAVSETLIDQLEIAATGGLLPDLVFVLDVDPEIGLLRAAASDHGADASPLDRFEAEDVTWHQRVRDGFLALAARDQTRYHVLNAGAPADTTAQQIATIVCQHLA